MTAKKQSKNQELQDGKKQNNKYSISIVNMQFSDSCSNEVKSVLRKLQRSPLPDPQRAQIKKTNQA